MPDFNTNVIEQFRANDGQVGPPFEGAPMVLVHHVGAKSGEERVTPLVYLPDGDRVVIFASAAGAPQNPAWFHNLKANPRVTLDVGDGKGRVETWTALAEEVTGAERDELYARQAAVMPGFAEYEVKTEGIRTIPVIALTRAG
ncbi:nitroreductase family deazaflavin-dependent oxidoreductase [Pseudonocardia sp. N23]|uniref:nitroreductase family deazaflavin-dependent oxidoreductase n=1 Tax=Pseudonocardia sp. N23 TaxID=1987376 RepID=UPI000BFC129F|nr:nitroreductase family deazaflavin-dependent oxidoreductase [Pseudonocardia sp. N23]GAY11762.1 AclJ protein [Pseudonocardia sp. N23]